MESEQAVVCRASGCALGPASHYSSGDLMMPLGQTADGTQ